MKVVSRINKPWGFEEILETNKDYTVKKIFLKEGHQCSYQYHKYKRETIYSLKGGLIIVLENSEMILRPGQYFTIEPLIKHRMRAEGGDCLYLECSTSELDDVIRIKDDYGRKETKKSNK